MFVFPPSPPSSGSGSGSSASLRAAESHATSSPAARQSTGMSSTSTTFAPSSRSSPSGASAGAALLHTMQMQMQAQLQHMQHMQMPMLTTTPPPTSLSFAPSSSSSSSSSSSLSFPHQLQHQHQHQQHIHQSQSLSPSPSLIPYQLPSASVSPHQQFSNNINSRNMTVPNDHSHQQQQSRQPLAAAPVVPLPVDLVRTVDPAGLGPSSVMPTATYVGYVEELADALYIFEGTQAGMLPRTTRRLTAAEKDRAVYHGAIHVFLERESGIKRWTDKLHWSASRIAGHFLMYREIEPATPAAKQAAAQAAAAVAPGAAAKVRTPTSSASSGAAAAGPTPPRSPAVTGGGTDANADAASSASDPAEKPACPMARKSGYAIKSTGLIKRTVSLVYRGITHHLVSYFDESRLAELPRPRLDPRLNHLPICSEVKPLLKKAQGSSAGQASSTTTATTVNGGSGGDMPQLAAHAKRAAADDPAEGVSTVNANSAGGAMYALESVVSHKRSRKTRTSPSAATTTAAAALSAIASQVSTPPQSPAQEPPAPQPDAGPPPPAQGQAAPAMVLPTHTSVFAPMPRSASCLSNGPQLVIDHTLHQAQSSTPCNSPPMFDTSLPTSPTSPHWPSTSSLAAPRPSSMIAAAASASATPRSGLSEWAPAAPGMPNEGPPPPTEYQSASSPVVGPGVYHTFMSPPQQLDLWSPAAHSPALSFEDHPPTAAQPAWVFAALPPMIPNEAAAAMGGGGVWGPAYGNANVAAAIAANQFWASTAAAAAAAQGGVYMHGPPPPPPPPPHHHHHMHHAAASVPMLSPNTFAQVLASPDPAADAFVYLPAAHAVPPHLMGMVPLDSLSATGASASAGTPVSASPMMPDASPLLSMQMDGMGIDSPVMHSAEMGGLMFGPGQGQERASAVMDLFATAPQQQQHMQAPAEFAAGGAGGCGSTLSGLFSPVMSPTAASGPTPSEFDVTAWLANGTSGTDEEDNQGKHKDVVGDGPEKQRR